MLKRFRPVSLILLVGALGFSGNLYATPMSGIPRVDISQQNAKVSGIVEDALGPVTGASVIVKGTTNGTMTDLDGHFTLDNVKKGDIIQISFGYGLFTGALGLHYGLEKIGATVIPRKTSRILASPRLRLNSWKIPRNSMRWW